MSTDHIRIPVTASCAFCDYIAGRRPYTVLDRGRVSAILVTREQRGLGHCLVVPVRHVPTILELTILEQQELMKDVVRVAAAIDAVERRPGLTVWQNNGEPASQSVPHVHFHVAGTITGGGTRWGDVPELSVEETDGIAERLYQALPPRDQAASDGGA